jgi:hypothetical protein
MGNSGSGTLPPLRISQNESTEFITLTIIYVLIDAFEKCIKRAGSCFTATGLLSIGYVCELSRPGCTYRSYSGDGMIAGNLFTVCKPYAYKLQTIKGTGRNAICVDASRL